MSVLDELVAGALEDQQARERVVPLEAIKRMAADAPAPIDARRWLKREDGVPVIAEIKRASPSKGYLGDIPDPAALARQYESGGASAISVLTEKRRFLGSLDDFDQVRAAVHIPLLRKDFMVNEYMVWESRAHGADIVLLIVAALDDDTLSQLLKLSESLGMTVLVEAHNREEIARAVVIGATVIGINARNLKNLHVDVSTYGELAADLPSNVIRVAESGVFGSVEVDGYSRAGADAVLVGEGVATADDHEEAVRTLVAAGARVKASEQRPLSTHEGPYFGQFGGRYVPEALVGALDELESVYTAAKADPRVPQGIRPAQPPVCRQALLADRSSALRRAHQGQKPVWTRGCSSSARTSTIQARTRSTTRSARPCSSSAWARPASSPRPEPASTAWPRRPYAPCSASNAASTWARSMPAGKR
jgi:tryptophan synthase beta chain